MIKYWFNQYINPFQQAFEILSKQVTTGVLKIIQEAIEATRIKWILKKQVFYGLKFKSLLKLMEENQVKIQMILKSEECMSVLFI